MELWVRSQNKEAIIKVNMGLMYWEDVNKRNCIVNKDNAKGLSILGAYKTKERALQVLDDIQNIISLHTSLAIVSQNVSILKLYIKQLEEEGFIDKYNSIKAVYQMPEE